MKKSIWIICLCSWISSTLMAQEQLNWDILADVDFRLEYIDLYGSEYQIPTFGKEIRTYQDKAVIVSGYMIPLDATGQLYVLSKNPYTSCYFCGGAGPETIIELWINPSKARRYNTDERLTFKGKLRLNDTDIMHQAYVLKEAEEVKQ